MPIYEYGCEACGHSLEVQQRISDLPLRTCPACGQDQLAKQISLTSFQLKGSGWYRDGYSASHGTRTEKPADRPPKAVDADAKKSAAA